ncbi:MAG: NAD(+)/NADH kinase [Planctomycetota bacterium]|jgi:NAD+ kinase
MAHVLALGDERKGSTKPLLEQFATWLKKRGDSCTIITDRDASLAQIVADLVVVFGGDGSLLGAARRMGDNQLPTLGINRGRLGFLTAFEQDETSKAVELALAGHLREEPRLLLRCSTTANPAGDAPVLCMNDGVVSRAAVGGMITLRVWRQDTELATFRGDGLIVATAAGSTAYSLAAGGPVLSPELDALVITPLASHSLSARPLVVSTSQGLEIEVLDSGNKRYAWFQVDGQVQMQVPVGRRAVLLPAPVRFRHLSLGPQQFFAALHAKLGFADLPGPRKKHVT